MSTKSNIEWTEATWNPITGCTKISPGCKYCYAERVSLRLQMMGQRNYTNGFDLTLHEHMLEKPLSWKKPRLIFVNSMSDLFHAAVPTDFILRIFDMMRRAHWHQFQILTKRSERLLGLNIDWPNNVWMGVSVENQDYTFRIDHLRETGAALKFLSLEPLLGPLSLNGMDLNKIDWVIVGGESGPKARLMDEEWVVQIRDQCNIANVPLFIKQMGESWARVNKAKNRRGGDISEWRSDLQVRNYPITNRR